MSSIGRSLNRVEAKKYYKIFCKDWSREKLKRLTTLNEKSGKPDKEKFLGRRPSFNQWLKVLNSQMAAALDAKLKARKEEEKKLIDAPWEEETTSKP